MPDTQLFACLRYTDAERGIAFLEALGFESRLVVRHESDPTIIEHAQLRWRDSGGVMLGSVRDDDRGVTVHAGVTTCSLVVAADSEVDQVLEKAVDAGATVVRPAEHPPYGGRSALVRDFDGNLWNIDSYAGE